MFSHIVVFWTDPANPAAVDELLAGLEKLRAIPGIRFFHAGRMVPSPRAVVDQTYQAALNVVFDDRQSHDAYQTHPLHQEFLGTVFKRTCKKVLVYDFA